MKHFVLTVRAEDRPGLLHLITGVIEKRLVKIISLNSAHTDLHDIVLVTIELVADENVISYLSRKLENIIEVFAVEVTAYEEEKCLRAAYFKLQPEFLTTELVAEIGKHQATLCSVGPSEVLIAKFGTEAAIRNLYNSLDGHYLIGFSQTGLINASKLMVEDQSSVISKAA